MFDEITSESPVEETAADTSDDFSIEVDEMPSDSSNDNEETTLDDFDFGEIEHSAVDSATPSDDIFNSDEEITSEETVIEDAPVEVHYEPSYTRSTRYSKRLSYYYMEHASFPALQE